MRLSLSRNNRIAPRAPIRPGGQIRAVFSPRVAPNAAPKDKNGLRQKTNFASHFKLIWVVQPSDQKYFYFRKSEFMDRCARPALMKRGVRVVTNVERGMRWTRWHQLTSDVRRGRRNRVVPMPRRWQQVCRLMNRQATEANKPGTPGRSRISRKPSRRECRLIWLPCCCLRAQSALSFARKARGCGLHPAFPAPSRFRGRPLNQSSDTFRAAGMRPRVHLHCRAPPCGYQHSRDASVEH